MLIPSRGNDRHPNRPVACEFPSKVHEMSDFNQIGRYRMTVCDKHEMTGCAECGSPTVYSTTAEHFHRSPGCGGLRDGQNMAIAIGNQIRKVESMSQVRAEALGKVPCKVCFPNY